MIDLVWPLRGSGLLGGAGVFILLLLILGTLPAGWALLRYRVGASTAGPLWLLLVFEVLACGWLPASPPFERWVLCSRAGRSGRAARSGAWSGGRVPSEPRSRWRWPSPYPGSARWPAQSTTTGSPTSSPPC